jgi:gluconokinase
VVTVMPEVIIMMGVAGVGKTTIGKMLAEKLGWAFQDADQFHPPANLEKMRSGIPLDDNDRAPWLAEMARNIRIWLDQKNPTILACSALKERYRQVLLFDEPRMRIVYLKGSPELLAARLDGRKGHFFSKELLPSQFAALEEPAGDGVIVVDVAEPPEKCVERILAAL